MKGVFTFCLGLTALAFAGMYADKAEARQVCVPFAQTESVGVDSKSINVCFEANQVRRVKTIYSGKSGNQVEVILADGTWFYKNVSKGFMNACIAGTGPCDKYQNVKLRDLTTGDVSIFKKGKQLHPKRATRTDRDIMACAGGSSFCP